MNANFKDSVIRTGIGLGNGNPLGNIKDGVIRTGSSLGNGTPLINIKDGIVRTGGALGNGKQIGKVNDFSIIGMEKHTDLERVACYHFLVKKII